MELPSEVFAIALHPTRPLLAAALLEGHVSCLQYELGGEMVQQWHTKRHKGSCRGVEFSLDGESIVTIGKDSVIKVANSETGKVISKDTEAHSAPIDAVKFVNENIFVTGDDLGIVKAWDIRTLKPTQTYPDTHIDHITSFLPLPQINPHQVLSTSGDCTLSVFDLRKSAALSTSEDQEDELLCSSFANDSRRICVGTSSGFITLWKTGEWMDHVDRIAPAERIRKGGEAPSIDCIAQVDDGVIVGLRDGVVRRVGFKPNRYGDEIGRWDDGVECLAAVPDQDGWVALASGSKVMLLNTNTEDDGAQDSDRDSSEEEKRKKKRKKSKAGKKSGGVKSTFFADLG